MKQSQERETEHGGQPAILDGAEHLTPERISGGLALLTFHRGHAPARPRGAPDVGAGHDGNLTLVQGLGHLPGRVGHLSHRNTAHHGGSVALSRLHRNALAWINFQVGALSLVAHAVLVILVGTGQGLIQIVQHLVQHVGTHEEGIGVLRDEPSAIRLMGQGQERGVDQGGLVVPPGDVRRPVNDLALIGHDRVLFLIEQGSGVQVDQGAFVEGQAHQLVGGLVQSTRPVNAGRGDEGVGGGVGQVAFVLGAQQSLLVPAHLLSIEKY